MSGVGRLKESIAKRGLGGTVRVLAGKGRARVVRRWRAVRELLFDLRHGVDTRGVGDVPEPGSNRYEVTPPRMLRRALRSLDIRFEEFAFVDLGCGKGAALLVAAELPFRRVVGVEVRDDLAEAARRTVRRARRPVEIVHADAAAYALPPGPFVLYLYNPFGEAAMRRVLENLAQSLREAPRPVRIVYWQPDLAGLLDAEPHLRRIGGSRRLAVYAAG